MEAENEKEEEHEKQQNQQKEEEEIEGRGSEEEEKKSNSRPTLRFDQSQVTTIPPSVRWFVKSIHIFSHSVPESNNRPDYISFVPLPPFILLENNETDRQLVQNEGKKRKEGCIPEQA